MFSSDFFFWLGWCLILSKPCQWLPFPFWLLELFSSQPAEGVVDWKGRLQVWQQQSVASIIQLLIHDNLWIYDMSLTVNDIQGPYLRRMRIHLLQLIIFVDQTLQAMLAHPWAVGNWCCSLQGKTLDWKWENKHLSQRQQRDHTSDSWFGSPRVPGYCQHLGVNILVLVEVLQLGGT